VQTPAQDDATGGGIKGGTLVLIFLGALVAVIGFVLIGFAAFDPEAAPCASGDMATNVLAGDEYQTRTEIFNNVTDAEAFICHDVPQLHADGWALERIEALRSRPLEFLVEGDALGVVTLGYLNDASGTPLTLQAAPFFGPSYFESQIPPEHTQESVKVKGIDATIYRYGINPNQVDVLWSDKTLEHRVTVELDDNLTQDDLLKVLDTLK
jgi:hypothetical protein